MKTQIPVLVGAAGLIAAAVLVVVPLTAEDTTSPGISVGEQSGDPVPGETGEAGESGAEAVETDAADPATPTPGSTNRSRASLVERPLPNRSGDDVCEWDDGEWECDDDDDDDDEDDDD